MEGHEETVKFCCGLAFPGKVGLNSESRFNAMPRYEGGKARHHFTLSHKAYSHLTDIAKGAFPLQVRSNRAHHSFYCLLGRRSNASG